MHAQDCALVQDCTHAQEAPEKGLCSQGSIQAGPEVKEELSAAWPSVKGACTCTQKPLAKAGDYSVSGT